MICLFINIFLFVTIYGSQDRIITNIKSDSAFSIKFPSEKNFFSDVNKPIGHKEAFGKQRPPLGSIPEYFDDPTPAFLWENHVKVYRPAVFRGLLDGSPALNLWNDLYLIKEYGDQDVLVEKKSEDRKTEPKRMTIAGFLKQYNRQEWYVVSMLPNVMKKDVKIPKPLKCSSMRNNLMELNLWIGTKGTRSMLHYDADNILHCLITGRKDWIFIHPFNKFRSDMASNDPGQGSGFSVLNVDNINLFNSPEVGDISWEYTTLYGGDCLYLPPQYLHQVRSYNRSISTTFLFYPHIHFNDDDCKSIDLDSYESLDKMFVFWGHKKGQETVDMGYGNPLEQKSQMLAFMNLFNFTSFTSVEYIYFLCHFSENMKTISSLWKETFSSFDQNSDGLLQYDEIETCDIEIFKKICRALEAPHGPTKSIASTHINLSNGSAEFNPRSHEQYIESFKARKLLVRIFKKSNVKNSLSFQVFSDFFYDLKNLSEAFLLLDLNMDGKFTFEELKLVSKEKLKQFYSFVQQSIPLQQENDEEEMIFENPIMKFLNKTLYMMSQGKVKSKINQQYFNELLKSFIFDHDENLKINSAFVFKLLDRSHKGYITSEDIKPLFGKNHTIDKTDFDAYEGLQRARSQVVQPKLSLPKMFSELTNIMMVVNHRFFSKENVSFRDKKDEL